MTREDHGGDLVDRIAHAFTPAEWSGRSLVVAIVVFALVGAVTVVQRALVADDATGWAITAAHAAVIAIGVPVLSMRAVRDWRAAQLPIEVPE